jgi:hypothetical protein
MSHNNKLFLSRCKIELYVYVFSMGGQIVTVDKKSHSR